MGWAFSEGSGGNVSRAEEEVEEVPSDGRGSREAPAAGGVQQ